MKTSIEWCDHSINPLRARHNATGNVGHYCEKIASGCKHCYSSRMQLRFKTPEFGGGQLRDDYELFLDDKKLQEVSRRRIPTRYFWCDMTDIFGAWVQPEWLSACFATMDATPHHTHLLLTKRPENIRKMWRSKWDSRIHGIKTTYREVVYRSNVNLIYSASDQATLDAGMPDLLACRDLCQVLGLSLEPLVGPVPNLYRWLNNHELRDGMPVCSECGKLTHHSYAHYPISCWHCDGPIKKGPRVDWVIVGGESGPNARPCRPEWIRSIVAQCRAAEVPCFVKQLGSNVVTQNDMVDDYFNSLDTGWPDPEVEHDIHGFRENYQGADCRIRLRDKKGGDASEWPADLRVREFPTAEVAV